MGAPPADGEAAMITRRHPRLVAAALVLTLFVAATGCSKSSKSSASSSNESTTTQAPPINQGALVKISEYDFSSADVTIKAGQSVEWRNDGGVAHTVTATSSNAFASASINPGQTYVQTFNKPGTYQYVCSIHPDKMKGTIVVTAASK
jgi:plastocyanin